MNLQTPDEILDKSKWSSLLVVARRRVRSEQKATRT